MLQGTRNLANASPLQLENLLESLGQPKFRKNQLIRWLWREGETDIEKMSNLSKDFRAKLIEGGYTASFPTIVTSQQSSDGTIKYLLKLEDGKTVETVWIPREDTGRVTLCVSTQVGCKMGCTFCLTAQQKVERNLAAGEIVGQLMAMPNREKITNLVFMGMGEPLDNYDNVMGALDILTHTEGLNKGPRKITVSTSGLVPAMKRFLKETKCRLAISLNAPTDAIRQSIMPINKAYNLDMLLGSLREIAHKPELRAERRDFYVTFEYILIKELNDRPEHALELIKRVRGIPCKINLLLYNENPNIPYKRPDMESVDAFRRVLSSAGLLNFVRTSRGRDISAACGQLASIHKREANLAPSSVAARL
ncbi:MAG: 23S rRNA (adenine(2503)-C(2))-methyltransferase RlmN [Bdellovibrionales bacterium]|nr:23S rRNA (adenine(2503)-C(2))-methyltransferase RlmN [Bdellovibrionales bacterium]